MQNDVARRMTATRKAIATAERSVSVKRAMRKMESAVTATADDGKAMRKMTKIKNANANETVVVSVTAIGTESEKRREKGNGSGNGTAHVNEIVNGIETTNERAKDEDITGETRVMSTKASLESRITTTIITIMITMIVDHLGIGSASSRRRIRKIRRNMIPMYLLWKRFGLDMEIY